MRLPAGQVAIGAALSISELLDVAKLLKVAENARQYGEQMQDKDNLGVLPLIFRFYWDAVSSVSHGNNGILQHTLVSLLCNNAI